jgi:hypothetical protein
MKIPSLHTDAIFIIDRGMTWYSLSRSAGERMMLGLEGEVWVFGGKMGGSGRLCGALLGMGLFYICIMDYLGKAAFFGVGDIFGGGAALVEL